MKEGMKRAGVKNKGACFQRTVTDGYLIQVDLSCVQEMIRFLRISADSLNQYVRKADGCGFVYLEDIWSLQEQQKLV